MATNVFTCNYLELGLLIHMIKLILHIMLQVKLKIYVGAIEASRAIIPYSLLCDVNLMRHYYADATLIVYTPCLKISEPQIIFRITLASITQFA